MPRAKIHPRTSLLQSESTLYDGLCDCECSLLPHAQRLAILSSILSSRVVFFLKTAESTLVVMFDTVVRAWWTSMAWGRACFQALAHSRFIFNQKNEEFHVIDAEI